MTHEEESMNGHVKDNWMYIQDFWFGFGRLPKDVDELDYLISYVEKRKSEDAEAERRRKSIDGAAKEATKDKESAVKFLKSSGIMDENGELAKPYRDDIAYSDEVEAAENRYEEEYKSGEYCHEQSFMCGFLEGVYWLSNQIGLRVKGCVLNETTNDKIHNYIANHFITDEVVKTDVKSIVKAMEEGVKLGIEEHKGAELSEEDKEMFGIVRNLVEYCIRNTDLSNDIDRENLFKLRKWLLKN